MRDKIQRLFIKGHKPRKIFARRLCGFYAGEPLAGKDLRRDPPTPPTTAGRPAYASNYGGQARLRLQLRRASRAASYLNKKYK